MTHIQHSPINAYLGIVSKFIDDSTKFVTNLAFSLADCSDLEQLLSTSSRKDSNSLKENFSQFRQKGKFKKLIPII